MAGMPRRDAREVAGAGGQLDDGSAGETGAPLLEIGLETRPFRQPRRPQLVGSGIAAACLPPVVLERRAGAVVRELLVEHLCRHALVVPAHTASLAAARKRPG
jgi:hypothetical protein